MYNFESLKESSVWRKIRVLTLFYMGDLEIVVLHEGVNNRFLSGVDLDSSLRVYDKPESQ